LPATARIRETCEVEENEKAKKDQIGKCETPLLCHAGYLINERNNSN